MSLIDFIGAGGDDDMTVKLLRQIDKWQVHKYSEVQLAAAIYVSLDTTHYNRRSSSFAIPVLQGLTSGRHEGKLVP